MRYMMIYKPGFESTAPPSQEEIVAMTQLIEEMARGGWLIATDGLQHSAKGARVSLENGKFTITDGPFSEAKEVVGGFAIMRANSLDHAKELAKRFLSTVGQGTTEIRLMHEQPAYEEQAREAGRAAAGR
jgi:hypothetical protein